MQPDRVFDFEPPEARTQWLPLAVRYKLDVRGLKMGLRQWQAIPLEQREALVQCPLGARFEHQLCGIVPAARKLELAALQAPRVFDEYVAARIPA